MINYNIEYFDGNLESALEFLYSELESNRAIEILSYIEEYIEQSRIDLEALVEDRNKQISEMHNTIAELNKRIGELENGAM